MVTASCLILRFIMPTNSQPGTDLESISTNTSTHATSSPSAMRFPQVSSSPAIALYPTSSDTQTTVVPPVVDIQGGPLQLTDTQLRRKEENRQRALQRRADRRAAVSSLTTTILVDTSSGQHSTEAAQTLLVVPTSSSAAVPMLPITTSLPPSFAMAASSSSPRATASSSSVATSSVAASTSSKPKRKTPCLRRASKARPVQVCAVSADMIVSLQDSIAPADSPPSSYELPTFTEIASRNFVWGSFSSEEFTQSVETAYEEVIHETFLQFQLGTLALILF